MAYKVLYRKYRPMCFRDVVGQPQVTITLKNELMAGRISHAYLFTGSRGTGKTTCAKILAKAVNCLSPVEGDPCGVCEACQGVDNGSVLDVMEIDAASNNGVDSIRALIEEAAFTPATSKYRVYIIDEVHMLSDAAFNALLKTLEEPPAHVIFILATTEVHKLLPTIISRCQRFDFKRIRPQDLAGRLKEICEKESAQIEDEAALLIARLSDGGMRDAISLLDQCMGRDSHISVKTVGDTAGVVGRDSLFAIADAIHGTNSGDALEIINGLHENSKDMSRLCEELADHFRNLMLIKTMGDKAGAIAAGAEELEKLREQALSMSLSAIIHCLDTLQRTLDKMKYSNQRIELEMALIRLCSPELDTRPEALLRRLEALEKGGRIQPRAEPAVQPSAPAKVQQEQEEPQSNRPEAAAAPAANASDGLSPQELSAAAKRFTDWPEVIHIMKQYSMTVGVAFGSSCAYISGDYMLVDGSPLAFEYLRKNSDHKDKLREAIFQVTGRNYRLGPYVGPKDRESGEAQEDPLADLTRRAKEAGIEIIES